jgi:nucleoside-diphosphate-sugar epimerase
VKVLVTGATGFIGRHVVDALAGRGHDVRALVRPAHGGDVPWSAPAEVARADLRVPAGLADALDGIDAVVHLAASVAGDADEQFASTVVGTENLLAAMGAAGVRRLVLASSMTVYAWSEAKEVLAESSPLEADPEARGGYTVAKLWQERLARRAAAEGAIDLTVLRPGAVWAPREEQRAEAGIPVGSVFVVITGGARLPLTHVENCADCIATAIDSPAAVGETFNVVDSAGVRPRAYLRAMGTKRLVPLPYRVGRAISGLAAVTARLLFGRDAQLPSVLRPQRFEARFRPLRFSTAKLEQVLGWTPPIRFDEAVARRRQESSR